MSSFLSPAPPRRRPKLRTPPSTALKDTPYKKVDNPLPFLSPLLMNGQTKPTVFNSDQQEAYESFLFNAYFFEFNERTKLFARKGKQAGQEDLLPELEKSVEDRVSKYTTEDLCEIKRFYREFAVRIYTMMEYLHGFTLGVPDDLVNAVSENLKPLRANVLDWGDVESCISAVAAQLRRFNDHLQEVLFPKEILLPKEVLLPKKVDNLNAAWIYGLAFLGLVVGISLHFVPVLGAAIAIPFAAQWLFLLVNILTPAVLVGAVAGSFAYAWQKAFFFTRAAGGKQDGELKAGVERLLIQVTRRLLIEEKVVELIGEVSEPSDNSRAKLNFMSP